MVVASDQLRADHRNTRFSQPVTTRTTEEAVQTLATVAVTAGGLFFSIVCALLLEELFFGALFRMFFNRGKQDPQKH